MIPDTLDRRIRKAALRRRLSTGRASGSPVPAGSARARSSAKAMLLASPALSVRDAVHAAVMLNHDVHEIATFDTGFDSVRGVSRVELS